MPPKFTIPQALQKYCRIRFLFLIFVLVILTINSTELWVDVTSIEQRKQYIPFYFQGFKFSGLDDILKNVEYVGYYTDKDLTLNQHLAQFSQAQYIVAPVILDLNNTQHEFILFDCTSEEKAFAKIKEIGAVALRKNKFGIILAHNPR